MQTGKKVGILIKEEKAWGKKGISISNNGKFTCNDFIYGEFFDDNVAVIYLKNDEKNLYNAILVFCKS